MCCVLFHSKSYNRIDVSLFLSLDMQVVDSFIFPVMSNFCPSPCTHQELHYDMLLELNLLA